MPHSTKAPRHGAAKPHGRTAFTLARSPGRMGNVGPDRLSAFATPQAPDNQAGDTQGGEGDVAGISIDRRRFAPGGADPPDDSRF
jgi:hypothetical protein